MAKCSAGGSAELAVATESTCSVTGNTNKCSFHTFMGPGLIERAVSVHHPAMPTGVAAQARLIRGGEA